MGLIVISCSDDDDQTYVDSLVGEYSGQFTTLDCSLQQTELSNEASTTTITKTSDSAIEVSIDGDSGTLYSFSANVAADSTITIPEFTAGAETLKGFVSKNPKLRVTLGGECIIFGTEAVTYRFDEN